MKLNKQNKIIVGVLALILTLTVGYAVFSQSLNITGTAKAEGNFSLIFEKDTENNPKCDGYSSECNINNLSSISLDKKTLNITVDKLTYPTAYVQIPVKIKNEGSMDALLEKIEVNGLSNDDIEVTYSITDEEIKKGYVIKANESKNMTVKVLWKEDSTNTNPETLNFTITLKYVQYTNSLVDNDQSTSSFPVIEGQLGENVFYTYNNGNISITGSGDMSEVECGSYKMENSCGLLSELWKGIEPEVKTDDDTVDAILPRFTAQFMFGMTYVDMGMTEESLKQMLITDASYTEEQAQLIINTLNSVPTLKSITIENGITSLRSSLFCVLNGSNLTITFPNTINKMSSSSVFDAARIGTVTFEAGTKTIYKNTCRAVDGKINNVIIPYGVEVIEESAISSDEGAMTTITIPESVTEIGKHGIQGKNLTTIVNKTGREFDWNYILKGVEGTPFETGTVITSSNETITITNN